ncbi:MAG: hypothetical protein AAB879_01145 [Patescibacteria group bacterium]
MLPFIRDTDRALITTFRRIDMPFARLAFFVVYFWFGALKLGGASPANPMMGSLLSRTLPFVTFEDFVLFFGLYEMLIGILFLIPKMERLVIALLIPHLFVTLLPLVLLPAMTWQGFLVPTLEGQYIIKNLAILALSFSIASHLRPLRK